MLYINKLTADAQQSLNLTGLPGIQIAMTLRYMPRTQSWVMGVTWGDVSIQGIQVVGSLNLLRQWRNIIPFGITCICPDGLDPYQLTDYVNQRASLYLLDAADVETIELEWFK